jgi:hypothetical protein
MRIEKRKLTKTYSFRVTENELKIIRELAREMDISAMLRAYIKECHKKYLKDPDDQVYKL